MSDSPLYSSDVPLPTVEPNLERTACIAKRQCSHSPGSRRGCPSPLFKARTVVLFARGRLQHPAKAPCKLHSEHRWLISSPSARLNRAPSASRPARRLVHTCSARALRMSAEDDGWDQPINRAPSRKRWRWSRDVTDFEEIEQIGEGTYGQVWMGRDKHSGEIVALKKVRMDQEKEGFPVTAIRELKMLRSLRHENIVNLKEIVTGQNQNRNKVQRNKHEIYMVFEYVDHDLTGLMDTPTIHFSEAQVKTYAKQLLSGLWYCHEREVLHRDIKGSNLLIDNKGNLKIADFGLARTFNDQLKRYTNRVITLWYRSPELLLGAEEYGPEVDMWSVGCLIVELLTKKPLFPGKDEAEQLELIFSVLGSPTESTWPGWQQLSLAHTVKMEAYAGRLRHKLKHLTPAALNLIEWLLKLDPKRRPSALEALDHEWFWCKPYPTPREELPKYRSTHEFQAKQRRNEAR